MKDYLEGLVVFDETFEPIFCTQKARLMLKASKEKDVPKVLLRKNGAIKTFTQIVGQLNNGQTEGWTGRKFEYLGEVLLTKTELKMDASIYSMVEIKNTPVVMKKTSFAIEKKNSKWEHEVLCFLIDDINKVTNFF